jgi:hypothetical protein
MEESFQTMSFDMGKQVLDPSSMPTFASKYFHMCSMEITILTKSSKNSFWVSSNFMLGIFFSKNVEFAPKATLERFLVGYIIL